MPGIDAENEGEYEHISISSYTSPASADHNDFALMKTIKKRLKVTKIEEYEFEGSLDFEITPIPPAEGDGQTQLIVTPNVIFGKVETPEKNKQERYHRYNHNQVGRYLYLKSPTEKKPRYHYMQCKQFLSGLFRHPTRDEYILMMHHSQTQALIAFNYITFETRSMMSKSTAAYQSNIQKIVGVWKDRLLLKLTAGQIHYIKDMGPKEGLDLPIPSTTTELEIMPKEEMNQNNPPYQYNYNHWNRGVMVFQGKLVTVDGGKYKVKIRLQCLEGKEEDKTSEIEVDKEGENPNAYVPHKNPKVFALNGCLVLTWNTYVRKANRAWGHFVIIDASTLTKKGEFKRIVDQRYSWGGQTEGFMEPLFKLGSKNFHGLRVFRTPYSKFSDFLVFTIHRGKIHTVQVPLNKDKDGLIPQGDIQMETLSAVLEKKNQIAFCFRLKIKYTVKGIFKVTLKW